jgi:hypothetical protein
VLTQRRPLVSLLGGAAGVTANKGKNESTSISEPMRGIAGSEWLPLIVLRPESKGGCEAALLMIGDLRPIQSRKNSLNRCGAKAVSRVVFWMLR